MLEAHCCFDPSQIHVILHGHCISHASVGGFLYLLSLDIRAVFLVSLEEMTVSLCEPGDVCSHVMVFLCIFR